MELRLRRKGRPSQVVAKWQAEPPRGDTVLAKSLIRERVEHLNLGDPEQYELVVPDGPRRKTNVYPG